MSSSLSTDSVFLDLTPRAKLRLTGADRLRFLNGQVSNDVRLATPGVSIYTGVMTAKGKLSGDAFIHAGDDFLSIDAEGALRESLAARLERYIIADDVQIEDVTDALGLFHVIDSADAPRSLPVVLDDFGGDLRTVRSQRFGRQGTDLFFNVARDLEVRERLLSAGIALLNDDALESLRILMGVPRWGAELDENTMPAEANLEERAVSYSKGCYIGQEVVSRIKSVGHVNRQLRGLRALDASPLYAGMTLLPVDAVPGGRDAGRITSAAPSAGHGGAAFVALGYVRRGWETPGTLLDAVLSPEEMEADGASDSDDGSTAPPPPSRVEVCSLPFFEMSTSPVRSRRAAGICRWWSLSLRRWMLAALALFAAGRMASASQAVIHFQVGDAKEDTLVTVELFDKDAPVAVENFKRLVAKKFYNATTVHRIIPDTLIQMGDPLSRNNDRSATGTGGPGYTLPAEIHRKHVRGAVAMAALPPALNPSRASNGSQFYVVLRPQPDLDKDYTVFGQVTGGLEFFDSISRRGRDTNDYPLEKVTIHLIELRG